MHMNTQPEPAANSQRRLAQVQRANMPPREPAGKQSAHVMRVVRSAAGRGIAETPECFQSM